MTLLYTKLEDVPLPDKIYNDPLEDPIVPIVKAVNAHDLTTSGSCKGHLDRFFPYPWVQFFPYENLKFLEFLISRYNQIERNTQDINWHTKGNTIRTEKEAKNQRELLRLESSIGEISQFLFQYRPEVLDPNYNKNIIKIPNPYDPKSQELDDAIMRTLDELIEICKQAKSLCGQEMNALEKTYKSKLRELNELDKKEVAMSTCIIKIPLTEAQVTCWIKTASTLIDN